MKRAGLLMILCALASLAFFALTDPRVMPQWEEWLGWGRNMVDARFDATAGSVIGLGGSMVLLLTGLWLCFRSVWR